MYGAEGNINSPMWTPVTGMKSAPWATFGLYTILAIVFVVVRIVLTNSPLNSDDNTYLFYANKLLSGTHEIYSCELPPYLIQQALRFGILIPEAIAILLVGCNFVAYYLPSVVFTFIGFLMIVRIARLYLPFAGVAAVVLLQTVLPFETRHSSLLLTDLPAAVMVLAYIVYVADRTSGASLPRMQVVHGFVASLFGFWGYLLRENQVLLLLPAMVILGLDRRYRLIVLSSVGFLAVWILLEQVLFMSKGVPFGYRWNVVRISINRYEPYLDIVGYSQYFLRSFDFVLRDVGAVGLTYYIAAITAHIYGIFTTRNAVIRAVLVSGLFTWAVFVLYPVGFSDGKLIVMPYMHRYVQLFTYSSLIAISFSISSLYKDLSRRSRAYSLSIAHLRVGRIVAMVLIVVCFAICLVSFSSASYNYTGRLGNPNNWIATVINAVNAELKVTNQERMTILGENRSLRVLSLFSNYRFRGEITWDSGSYRHVIESLKGKQSSYFLRDLNEERWKLKLGDRNDSKRYSDSIFQVAYYGYQNYHPIFQSDRFLIYKRDEVVSKQPVTFPNMDMKLFDLKKQTISRWVITQNEGIRLSLNSDSLLEVSATNITTSAYIFSDEGLFNVAPRNKQDYIISPSTKYTYFLCADVRGAIDVNLWVIEYGDTKRIRHTTQSIEDGVTTATIETDKQSKYFSVAFSVTGSGTFCLRKLEMSKILGEVTVSVQSLASS